MNRLITFDDNHERFENDNVLIIKDGENRKIVFKNTQQRPRLLNMFRELNKPVERKNEYENVRSKI